MNRKIRLILIFVVVLFAASACSPATAMVPSPLPPVTVIDDPTPAGPSQAPLSEADVPRVSVEEAAAAIQSGEAVVVDVRSTEAYQAGHIPGALSIPLLEIETNPTGLTLDKGQWIITYCT